MSSGPQVGIKKKKESEGQFPVFWTWAHHSGWFSGHSDSWPYRWGAWPLLLLGRLTVAWPQVPFLLLFEIPQHASTMLAHSRCFFYPGQPEMSKGTEAVSSLFPLHP